MKTQQYYKKEEIKAIGIMSGTSLDGLDITAVDFYKQDEVWSFNIVDAKTISYSAEWMEKLIKAPTLSGQKLIQLHSEYGNYLGTKTNEFIKKTRFHPNVIASHGHTIFHQPQKHFTLQIGNGAEIAAITKTTTVADFRITDIALGGQGAPLVPVGDKLLFGEFESCLNLGGFGNVSFEQEDQRIAYDTCPVNIALNYFAEKQGLAYDRNGALGKQGKLNKNLLIKLNNLDYYHNKPPKSLGREWMEEVFLPVVNSFQISEFDKMRTIYEHIAILISKIETAHGKILVTGGGAFNTFLMERIMELSSLEVVIPAPKIINYKEALIFAFLGVLRIQNRINCFSSVTGATRDSCCGVIFSA